MPNAGLYCKAYSLDRFAEFSGWRERAKTLPDIAKTTDEQIFLFLHENFTVTDGIFVDENVVFDSVTEEWKNYCLKALEFDPAQHYSCQDGSITDAGSKS